MPSIAFTLIGHNEARNLPRTLDSVRWADQIVYVDCGSTDGSAEVARRYTQHVLARPNLANLNINKNAAIDEATADWVFLLDADEVIPAALAEELRRVGAAGPRENAFRLARRNFFFGRWVRHGGQYPDHQTRLFRRGTARFPCRHVHERLAVDGAVGTLREAFDHYTVDTPLTAIRKMNFNSSFNGAELARSGQKPGPGIAVQYLLTKPLSRFVRRYVLKGGFLDGWPGLVVAALDAMDFPFRLFKFWYWAEHPEQLPDTQTASGTVPGGYA
jgi:glycosyltransferase involved in cell wall biosynthesis